MCFQITHSSFSINELACLVTVPGMRFLYLLALLKFSANHNNTFINKSLGRRVNVELSIWITHGLLSVAVPSSRGNPAVQLSAHSFGPALERFWHGAGDALCESLFPVKLSAWQGLIARFQWGKSIHFSWVISVYPVAGRLMFDQSLLSLGLSGNPSFFQGDVRYRFANAFGLTRCGNV